MAGQVSDYAGDAPATRSGSTSSTTGRRSAGPSTWRCSSSTSCSSPCSSPRACSTPQNGGANPGVETFGDAFYFVVVALTTVGFGDIVPVTGAGRMVTVAAILAGIILIPWRVSRIVKQWTGPERTNVTCPACGLTGHEPDASHCRACGAVIYQEYSGSE